MGLGTTCNLWHHPRLLSTKRVPGPGSGFASLLPAALRGGPQ